MCSTLARHPVYILRFGDYVFGKFFLHLLAFLQTFEKNQEVQPLSIIHFAVQICKGKMQRCGVFVT